MDDPRNTDNSWMETVAMNFHDETRKILCDFVFEVRNRLRKLPSEIDHRRFIPDIF